MGSDSSGLDAAAAALKRMGVKYSSEFMCDNSKHCKKILSNVYAPKRFFNDIMDRDEEALPDVDLYIWTPPCQDVSPAGQKQGVDGPRNMGTLMKQSMKYIKKHRPRLTIFENAPGLAQGKFKHIPRGIVAALEKLGYKVYMSILNSRDYGLPQDRRRLFIVGFKIDAMKREFKWPTIVQPAPSINTILDPWKPTDKAGRLPTRESGANLCKNAYKHCFSNGRDPRSTPVVVDIDCSVKYSTYGVDEAKTLTRARGGSGGPWISTRGRRCTIDELIKLQVFKDCDLNWQQNKLSERQLGQMLGNAISLCDETLVKLSQEGVRAIAA